MKNIKDVISEVSGKIVIVRANYDVDVVNNIVQDETRIDDSLDTINLLLSHGCKVVLIAHMGRPDGSSNSEFSLIPVRALLENKLGEPIDFITDINAEKFRNSPSRVVMLENLRFWAEEEKNDQEFASRLASLGDFYVNEAFANCHRKHASVVALPKILPHAAGLHLHREIEILSKARHNPDKPLVVLIGGSKVETKAPLVDAFLPVADLILVGGLVAKELSEEHKSMPNVIIAELTDDGKDITEKSARYFAEKVMEAKTVVWNGTMGLFEEEPYRLGTTIVAEAMTKTDGFTIVGGGDTEAALTVLGWDYDMDFISTGGGAMLDYLCDGELVAITALD